MANQSIHQAFYYNYFLVRRKVFKVFGGAFHVYDEGGNLVLYSEQKAFKLREDMRLYADESKSQELLVIKTPQILDLGATYNITDGVTGSPVGALKRKAFKSIVKDEWVFLDAFGNQIGKLTEKSNWGAIVSRLITLIPQKYLIVSGDQTVAEIDRLFNPFVLKFEVRIVNPNTPIDRRLILAAGILLAAIEGRQE